jgi:uncharacterized protein
MTTNSHFSTLAKQQYINLISYRANGEAVKTPVWFAQIGEKLYVMTFQNSGKIKRIKRNQQIAVEPSDQRGKSLGAEIPAQASIMPAEQQQMAIDALNKKYGFIKWLFDVVGKLTRNLDKRVYLEITVR